MSKMVIDVASLVWKMEWTVCYRVNIMVIISILGDKRNKAPGGHGTQLPHYDMKGRYVDVLMKAVM